MENYNNRNYRNYNRISERTMYERSRRRVVRRRIFAVVSGICLLLAFGIFGYFILGQEKNSPSKTNTTVNQTSSNRKIFTEEDLNVEEVEELIVQAESMRQDGYAEEKIEKLDQRIAEAKKAMEDQKDMNRMGIAYMNLVVAMEALESAQ